jgi:hypothetical protein
VLPVGCTFATEKVPNGNNLRLAVAATAQTSHTYEPFAVDRGSRRALQSIKRDQQKRGAVLPTNHFVCPEIALQILKAHDLNAKPLKLWRIEDRGMTRWQAMQT